MGLLEGSRRSMRRGRHPVRPAPRRAYAPALSLAGRRFINLSGWYTSTVVPSPLLTVLRVRTRARSPFEVRRDSITSQCT